MSILKDKISELRTITDLLDMNDVFKKNKELCQTLCGWKCVVEYESADEMILVGRAFSTIPKSKLEPHIHKDTIEFITLLKGEVDIGILNEIKTLKEPLSSVIIQPNVNHFIINKGVDTEIIYITIPVDPGLSKLGGSN